MAGLDDLVDELGLELHTDGLLAVLDADLVDDCVLELDRLR